MTRDAFDPEPEPEPLPFVGATTETLVVNGRRPLVGDDFVKITRGTPFGNPFPISKARDRAEAIEQFRVYFTKRVAEEPAFRAQVLALRGKTLMCVCKPLPCHGDVIAAWLNDPENR